jgi:hypothetical protein
MSYSPAQIPHRLQNKLITIASMAMDQRSLERGYALQKYFLLHSQHDALQQHITQIFASMSSSNTVTTSPSQSPIRSRPNSIYSTESDDSSSVLFLPPAIHVRHHQRSGSMTQQQSRYPRSIARTSSLPTVVDETIIGEIRVEEMKMRDVNLQIKSTLTELLNCESVRNDEGYRMWVQSRLMDAERELRGARRRRSD